MNIIDLICLAVVVIALLFGLWKGLFFQVGTLIALLAAIFLSSYAAVPVVQLLGGKSLLNDVHTFYVARIVMGAVIYFSISIVVWFLNSRFKRSTSFKVWNLLGGGALGAAKGTAIVVAVLFALTFVSTKMLYSFVPPLEYSWVMQQVQKKQKVSPDFATKNMMAALKLVTDPEGVKQLSKFLQERGVDPKKATAALNKKRFNVLLKDPRLRDLLNKEEVFAKLAPALQDPAAVIKTPVK